MSVESIVPMGKEVIVDLTDTDEGLTTETLCEASTAEYHDPDDGIDTLREAVKAAGVEAIARVSGISVRALRDFVNGRTKPQPSTRAGIEAPRRGLRLPTMGTEGEDRTFQAVDSFKHQGARQVKTLDFGRCELTCVAFALLAACGGSQPPMGMPGAMPLAPQTRSVSTAAATPTLRPALRSLGYKVTAPLLYVTNIGNFSVTVYQARANDPAPLATISDGINHPGGACIDGQGMLYVVNEPPGSGWVSEYPLGKTTPSTMITDGMNGPAYCALDGKGNLWVTNIYGPNVTEYLKGSKKPHTVITTGLVFPVGIAIDRSGNLYVGNFGSSAPNVVVYAPGSKSPSRMITNGVTSPRGLAVDSNRNLYVPNIYQNTVAEYRSGQDDPFQTITKAMDHPEAVTVDKKRVLYVGNLGNNTIVEFAPGSLTPRKRQISVGLDGPNGVAYYPAWLP